MSFYIIETLFLKSHKKSLNDIVFAFQKAFKSICDRTSTNSSQECVQSLPTMHTAVHVTFASVNGEYEKIDVEGRRYSEE